MKGGLTRRILVASVLLAVVVGAAFAVLLSAVADLRRLEEQARRSEEVLVVANRLERLVVDLETGQRGYLLTGADRFLEPWQAARTAFPAQAQTLERLVAGSPRQLARAQQIRRDGISYLENYSIPLIEAARHDRASATTAEATEEGKRRVDDMRAAFDQFVAAEDALAAAREAQADDAATRATLAAAGGLTGSIVLVAVFTIYLAHGIVRPVRRAASMAGRLAAGDLAARLPEDGIGEVGVLQRSFNTMARALEHSRRELAASRARIVTAGDRARRRIERDLHDGTQQRLVSLVLELRAAQAAVPPEAPQLEAPLTAITEGLIQAQDELRELTRGIHPAVLSDGGLRPALTALARRSKVPVELEVDLPSRLPEPVEVAAYYVVSEALANTTKHAEADSIWIHASADGDILHLSIRDDGVGGASASTGTGLIGLADRVQALGGTISVTSPLGVGTTVLVDLPLGG